MQGATSPSPVMRTAHQNLIFGVVLGLVALLAHHAVRASGVNVPEPAIRMGQIQLVYGVVSIRSAQGVSRAAASGDPVFEGDRIITGENSRLYVVTQDSGFLSLRPQTELTIEGFRLNPSAPKDVQIRYRLHSGVVRVVTGSALEGAKDRFRMNTPIAAIGVRGTDFSVLASDSVTRVSVLRGQVAVSPFVNGCTPSGLGPCTGASVVDLAGGSPAVLQVLPGDLRPSVLNRPELSPDRVVPPQPDEQPASKPKAASEPSTQPSTQAVTPPVASPVTGAISSVNSGVGVSSLPTELGVAADVTRRVTAEPRIHWGRWQAFAGLPADQVESLVSANSEARFFLGPFFITRSPQGPERPTNGSFTFTLRDASAFLLNETSGSIEASLAVENPRLTIDFTKSRFTTDMNLVAPGQDIPLRATGAVTSKGLLHSDYISSNATVRGMVSGSDQAGYLFHRPIETGTNTESKAAVGVTRWVR